MIRVHRVDSPESGGAAAADVILAMMQQVAGTRSSGFVLGLATGSTPSSTWQELGARSHRAQLSDISAFALDEYLDISEDHPQSYRSVISREITVPLGLTPELVRVPGDDGKDEGAPARYEQRIRAAGGIDLQVLGIGRNGHIAFNEPGSSLTSRCRIAPLSEQTRRDNSRFFPTLDQVPRYCITQGVGTILEARRLLLLAYGTEKAEALRDALEGPVTAAVPASAIQRHPDVTVIADDAAVAALTSEETRRR